MCRRVSQIKDSNLDIGCKRHVVFFFNPYFLFVLKKNSLRLMESQSLYLGCLQEKRQIKQSQGYLTESDKWC